MDTWELKELATKATLLMAEAAAKAAQELAAKAMDHERNRLAILSQIAGCLTQVQYRTFSRHHGICLAFVVNGGRRVGGFISNLDKFASTESPDSNPRRPEILSGAMSNELIESPDEYPATVNALLYTALSRHFNCTCPGDSPREHWARLRLATRVKQVEDHVLFDLLFSAAPAGQCLQQTRWQQLRLQVPRYYLLPLSSNVTQLTASSRTRRSIRFAQDDGKDESQPLIQVEKHTVIQLGRFCALLGRPLGGVCVPLKIVNGHLCELDNPALPDQQVAKASSVSLSDVLEKHRLLPRVKIALAYTLAKAVWRYYDSDFMRTPWTTESVHFMREDRRNMSQDEINPANPCFAFRPLVSEEPKPTEYCNYRHVCHRYPRVLALGVLLVAIVENQVPRSHAEGSSTEERMNDDLMTCRDIAKGKHWPNLGLQSEEASLIYRDARQQGLSTGRFASCEKVVGKTASWHHIQYQEWRFGCATRSCLICIASQCSLKRSFPLSSGSMPASGCYL
ncbi:hypothetical protein FALCPG4_007813 [Fusarium falciforme]